MIDDVVYWYLIQKPLHRSAYASLGRVCTLRKVRKEFGELAGEGRAHWNLGNAYQRLGDHSTAYHTQDLAITKEVGNRAWEVRAYAKMK